LRKSAGTGGEQKSRRQQKQSHFGASKHLFYRRSAIMQERFLVASLLGMTNKPGEPDSRLPGFRIPISTSTTPDLRITMNDPDSIPF